MSKWSGGHPSPPPREQLFRGQSRTMPGTHMESGLAIPTPWSPEGCSQNSGATAPGTPVRRILRAGSQDLRLWGGAGTEQGVEAPFPPLLLPTAEATTQGLGLQNDTPGTLGPAPFKDAMTKICPTNTYMRRPKRKKTKENTSTYFSGAGERMKWTAARLRPSEQAPADCALQGGLSPASGRDRQHSPLPSEDTGTSGEAAHSVRCV